MLYFKLGWGSYGRWQMMKQRLFLVRDLVWKSWTGLAWPRSGTGGFHMRNGNMFTGLGSHGLLSQVTCVFSSQGLYGLYCRGIFETHASLQEALYGKAYFKRNELEMEGGWLRTGKEQPWEWKWRGGGTLKAEHWVVRSIYIPSSGDETLLWFYFMTSKFLLSFLME